MRQTNWLGLLFAVIGLVISAGIAWAGVALWSPQLLGIETLPEIVSKLPFERRWWAVAMMLLGVAGIASVFPSPRDRRRSGAANAAQPADAIAPLAFAQEPVAATDPFCPLPSTEAEVELSARPDAPAPEAPAPEAHGVEPVDPEPVAAPPPAEASGEVAPPEPVDAGPEPSEPPRPEAPADDPAPSAPSEAAPEDHDRQLVPTDPAIDEAAEQEHPQAALEAPHPGPFEPAPTAPHGDGLAAACAAAEALRQQGRSEDALERYQALLPDARERLHQAPGDPLALRDLADVLKGIGDLEDEAGRLAAAIDAYEEGLGLRRSLAAIDPSPAHQRALSVALERLADAREARGHRSQALALYEESLPLAEGLAAAQPDDPVLAADLAATRQRLEALKAWMATA